MTQHALHTRISMYRGAKLAKRPVDVTGFLQQINSRCGVDQGERSVLLQIAVISDFIQGGNPIFETLEQSQLVRCT